MPICRLCFEPLLQTGHAGMTATADHFRLVHPDIDADPERWPDGAWAVTDTTLQPSDFKETSVSTHTRTHVYVEFANPYLRCDRCGEPVSRWHDNERCGCIGGLWNEPCGHTAGVTSICPSWGPVDGCQCAAQLGEVPHGGAR